MTPQQTIQRKTKEMRAFSEASVGASEHKVLFYENDAYLLELVQTFIEAGDVGVVITTPEHRQALAALWPSGSCAFFDAQETLARFMVGGLPDPERFSQVIGGIMSGLPGGDTKVHAFGEMVAILHEQGNTGGALQLEELWNGLQARHDFALLCAYPMRAFGDTMHREHFAQVCDVHSTVVPTESYAGMTDDGRQRQVALLQQKAAALHAEIERSALLERHKADFLTLASHELKTPVTSIKAYGQMLEREFLKRGDKDAATLLKKMDVQVDRLTALIDHLLDL